ncbi:MAG TPA: LLM class flavin-dependent oxidoreductase [Candidatus Tectomicrobia bacterium]|nr:LLM class flavin-dependent oxidoreductase [Candidatus Tectomicrobia bacterium]
MGKLEIGLYDVFTQAAMATSPVAADVYDEHIDAAQEAEQLGYKYYFSIEHQTSSISYLSAPSVYLTALARNTSAIRFGVMIFQLPFHNPIRLAQDAAMLDHLSRGRLEFGAGTGVSPHEFLRWNVPFERRREISEEALEIILKAWTEDSVTYDGEFFKFVEVLTTPKPYQQPHPPVWFAAHSAASFEYAARHNFHVSQNIDIDPVIAQKFATWRQLWKECGHSGPMPRTFLTRHVHVAETDEQAKEEAAPHLATPRVADPEFLGAGREMMAQIGMGPGPDGRYAGEAGTPERLELRRVFRERSKSYDFWIDNGLALVGSPDTVIRKVQEQQALIGHDVLCTQHGFGQMAPELVKKSIKLFGEEVIPAFA